MADEEGPGNALTITVEHEGITEVFTGFGEKGVSAESVAKRAVDAARSYLASEAVVGSHLAHQLLLPMALAGGGEFVTMPVTRHFESHVEIIEKFLSNRVATKDRRVLVCVMVR
jgi:RNA 3'-terminal phosphate cyclase (ATP)